MNLTRSFARSGGDRVRAVRRRAPRLGRLRAARAQAADADRQEARADPRAGSPPLHGAGLSQRAEPRRPPPRASGARWRAPGLEPDDPVSWPPRPASSRAARDRGPRARRAPLHVEAAEPRRGFGPRGPERGSASPRGPERASGTTRARRTGSLAVRRRGDPNAGARCARRDGLEAGDRPRGHRRGDHAPRDRRPDRPGDPRGAAAVS